MNRILVIGNGFDRALNIKSGYNHFIDWYIKKCLIEAQQHRIDKPSLIIHTPLKGEVLNYIWQETNAKSIPEGWDDVVNYLKLNSKNSLKKESNYIIQLKSGIIKKAINDINVKGWADIEKIYYELLVGILGNSGDNQISELTRLNNELFEIKEQLQGYLFDEVKDIKAKKNRQGTPTHRIAFTEFEKENFIDKEWVKLGLSDNHNRPDKVCILNFNYTNLFKSHNDNVEIINIHGELKNEASPIVFGYGDDLDENYQKIEKLSEDKWLEGFKSFDYLKTNEYKRLLNFMSKDSFEVFIVGHSCGLSDKTLLNLIFEYDDCQHIKVFHSKELNNFDEIIFNISRIMGNKLKFRQRVGTKDETSEVRLMLGLI